MACSELDTGSAQGWLQLPRLGLCRKHGRPPAASGRASGPCLSLSLPSLTPRMLFCLLGSLGPFTLVSLVYSWFSFKPFVLKRKKKKRKLGPTPPFPRRGSKSSTFPLPRPRDSHGLPTVTQRHLARGRETCLGFC